MNQTSSRAPIALAACVVLSACTSLTGVGGTDEYGCKAPAGVKCDSVSGTYYNALQNNLPSQRRSSGSKRPPDPVPKQSPAFLRDTSPQKAMTAAAEPTLEGGPAEGRAVYPRPLRTQARVLRLWFKAFEDSDHDLHDEGFVFVQIDSGRWLIDHVQRETREAFAPIRPPRTLGDATRTGPDAKARPAAATPESSSWPAAENALRQLGRSQPR